MELHAPADYSPSDISFLSFALDTGYRMWERAEEVLENMQRGVRDRFENRRLFAVPFNPQDVCSFVFSHEPFSPGGLVCLYHSLVHEFGRERVNAAISANS